MSDHDQADLRPYGERLAVVETHVAAANATLERLEPEVNKITGIEVTLSKLEPKVDLLVARSVVWSGATSAARAVVPFIAVGVSLAALVFAIARGG